MNHFQTLSSTFKIATYIARAISVIPEIPGRFTELLCNAVLSHIYCLQQIENGLDEKIFRDEMKREQTGSGWVELRKYRLWDQRWEPRPVSARGPASKPRAQSGGQSAPEEGGVLKTKGRPIQ